MEINLIALARQATAPTPVMVGRNRLNDFKVYDTELTVIEFGLVKKRELDGRIMVDENGEPCTYAAIVFKEYPDHYYCTSGPLNNVCRKWSSVLGGDEAASKALIEQGGVKVIMDGYSVDILG